jgi:hypothetical protein
MEVGTATFIFPLGENRPPKPELLAEVEHCRAKKFNMKTTTNNAFVRAMSRRRMIN